MTLKRAFFSLVTVMAFALTGCADQTGQRVVTSGASAGKVVYGTLMSYQAVTIKDKKNLSDNALGGIAGGAAGGVAGSTVGDGKGQTLATIGGVIAGAVIGAAVEDQLSTKQGFEYIVQLDSPKNPNLVGKRSKKDTNISRGGGIEDELSDSVIPNDTAMDAVSIIQDDKQPIPVGTRVMIVYRDDGARVTPMR